MPNNHAKGSARRHLDLCCQSHCHDGAMCQKIRGHIGDHGGVDTHGSWRHWLGGER